MNQIDPRALREHNPRFEAKLSFDERCSILALYRRGVSPKVISAAFGVNRRTTAKIVMDKSPRYQAVRDKEKAMGEQEFCEKYVTERAVALVNAAAEKPEVKETYTEYDKTPLAERQRVPSQRASGCAGITPYKSPHMEFAHNIEVRWHEANTLNGVEHPAGWYWRDLDGDSPDFWQGDPDEASHTTSAKALDHAKRTI